jgi:hypothetical protein
MKIRGYNEYVTRSPALKIGAALATLLQRRILPHRTYRNRNRPSLGFVNPPFRECPSEGRRLGPFIDQNLFSEPSLGELKSARGAIRKIAGRN